MDESEMLSSSDSIGSDNETSSAPFSRKNEDSTKDTSPGSQAVASESRHSDDYRYLGLRPRSDSKQDSNSGALHSSFHPNPEKAVPLTQMIMSGTSKNPYTGEVINYTYIEYKANTKPIKGFGCQRAPEQIELPASKPKEPVEPWKIFPPPPNAAYIGMEKVEEDYDPQQYDAFDAALDGAELAIKNTPSPQKSALGLSGATRHTRRRLSVGGIVATRMDFTQKAWVEFEPSVIGEIYSGDEQKADFIKNLDEGAQIEYCKKCKERHIPPGSALTLPERDTCGAYLPEWFPTKGIHKPWTSFIEMINHWVRLNEINQGYNHKENPERHLWNLEFHESHDKWKQIGRTKGHGGWWKCRSGPGATYAERSCRVCTSKDAISRDNEVRAQKLKPSALHCKQSIENWVARMIKEAGRRDKEIVLAMWRTNGIPLHYGPRVARNGTYPLTEGTRTINIGVPPSAARTLLLPEQMFSERLFRGNGKADGGLQSIDEALEIMGGKCRMGSPVSSTDRLDIPRIVVQGIALSSIVSS
ncbi:d3d86942-86cd-43c9-aaa4-24c7eb99b8e3 [Sclerotinia trifoliorum]|uniref:D3d86942-86cd-43c9-aaa4-24c7eb99b8e3 n=1 Tax=Sclerotinia trifoliorum TaxID=28548 RepID=A0A8H2ZVI7_9HELO|nr:d3d86942-86cd-43c9-aaa4-24c7eb99b8e3 [Sclerotinia trifoliorum]